VLEYHKIIDYHRTSGIQPSITQYSEQIMKCSSIKKVENKKIKQQPEEKYRRQMDHFSITAMIISRGSRQLS
jgi:hypothetical protein